MDRSIGRPAADLALVDVATGDANQADRPRQRQLRADQPGRQLRPVFPRDDHFWTINTATPRGRRTSPRARRRRSSNRESDPTDQAEAAVRRRRLDDRRSRRSSSTTSSTSGKSRPTAPARRGSPTAPPIRSRHRYVRLDPDEECDRYDEAARRQPVRHLDRSSRGTARLHRRWRGRSGSSSMDKSVGSLAKAKDADVYSYVVQIVRGFAGRLRRRAPVSPRPRRSPRPTRSSRSTRGAAPRSSSTRPRRASACRASSTIRPATSAGKKYPMIVYLYETALGRRAPLRRAIASATTTTRRSFTSLGYFVFQPDIVFRPRDPGLSVDRVRAYRR